MNAFDDLDKWYKQKGYGGDEPHSEARQKESIEKLLKWAANNPILKKYEEHIRGSHSRNTLPEHALGERIYACFTCALAARGDIPIVTQVDIRNMTGTETTESFLKRSAIGIAIMMMKANVYLWSDKMEKLADAAPLPRHTVSREVLPHPLMFWSRETRYVFEDAHGREAANNWVALIHHTDQVFVVGDLSYHDTQTTELAIDLIQYGRLWPDDYHDAHEKGRLLKRCSFISSPFVVSARRRMTHTTRRQLERDHYMPREECNEPECAVVALRRLVVTKSTGQPREHSDVEWKHHWWVSAHHRAQWYPSDQAHRVIWIAPFLKGDPSKPLLEKVYAVVR